MPATSSRSTPPRGRSDELRDHNHTPSGAFSGHRRAVREVALGPAAGTLPGRLDLAVGYPGRAQHQTACRPEVEVRARLAAGHRGLPAGAPGAGPGIEDLIADLAAAGAGRPPAPRRG